MALVALVATNANPNAARAAGTPAAGKAASTVELLASDDDDAAVAAAKRLGDTGGAAAVEALDTALATGLRPPVATQVLLSLAKLKDPRSASFAAAYAGNLNVPVRVAAIKVLAHVADAKGTEILLERLGDSAPPVRTAAAEALAARKEPRAVKRLLLLVARNDAGAAGPLGELIPVAEIPRLAELHGRADDAVLATAFGEVLKRSDVPDRLRLDVVRTLARLPGAAATAALVEYLASVPAKDQRPSKEEAQKLVDQRGGR